MARSSSTNNTTLLNSKRACVGIHTWGTRVFGDIHGCTASFNILSLSLSIKERSRSIQRANRKLTESSRQRRSLLLASDRYQVINLQDCVSAVLEEPCGQSFRAAL